MEDKKLIPDSHYEERRITPRWRRNTLPQAGIWLVDGGYRVVVRGSEAEAALLEQGGILVAGVVFDGAHGERPVGPGVALDIFPAEDLPELGRRRSIEALGWAPAGN